MKKLVLFLLLITMIFNFTACGKKDNKISDTETDLNIMMLEAGYGVTFANQLKNQFEAQYPQYKVHIETDVDATIKATQNLPLGPSNPVDLYLCGDVGIPRRIKTGKGEYKMEFEDLTELFKTVIPGENVTIEEKMIPEFLRYCKFEDKYYNFPWAHGPCGLMYNVDYFKEKNWQVPRTTNELIKLCYDNKGDKIKPLIWAGGNASDYWLYIMDMLWAQYEGAENYLKFWYLDDGNGGKTPEVYNQQGLKKALKVVGKLVQPSVNYRDSASMDHTQAQMYFLQKKAAMIPSGNWMATEMENSFPGQDLNIKLMKTPILSDLGVDLEFAGPSKTPEEHEQKLIEVIDYIDGGEKGIKPDVEDIKIEAIKNARKITFSLVSTHNGFIPSYSNAKEAAKKFLQFMASDKGINILRTKSSNQSAFKYNIPSDEKTSIFMKSHDEILKNAVVLTPGLDLEPLRYMKGISRFNVYTDPFAAMVENGADFADVIFKKELEKARENFNAL